MNKTLKINIPKGYEIDNSLSTFENIVFKPVIPKQLAEDRMREIWRSCNNVKYSSDGCRTYYKNNEPMFQQDWNNKKLYYRYSLVYKIFSDEYKMKEVDINNLVIKVLSQDLNTTGLVGVWGEWEIFCLNNPQ